jgi:hypothetical protein
MLHTLLLLALPAQFGAALPDDSVARLRGRARSAEARFERLARSQAPRTWGGGGQDCDEIVGRFCLTFDSTTTLPAGADTDKAATIDARRDAVEAFRRYFAGAPGELSAAGPLVRLLVHDGRAREAVSAARTFAALSADSVWAHLLLALAHHGATDDPEAERHFMLALSRMDEAQRRAWTDPRWLLDPGERGDVRRLSPEARTEYERRFWLASDPFWLMPANEIWVEHMARHAEARLLEDVPVVGGMSSWGPDLHELTVRFGTATGRAWADRGFGREPSMIEYFDSTNRNYVAESWLNDGFPEPPPPGTRPLLYAARARSGYGVRLVDRVLDLPHQLTRFADGEQIVLRVDGAVASPNDSVGKGALDSGLFVYDSAFTRLRDGRRRVAWQPDSTRFTLTVRTEPGRVMYSVEALDSTARFGARARYALDALLPGDGPVLSDVLICAPFPADRLPLHRDDDVLRARSSLVFAPGDTLGIYAEVYRLAVGSARVEIGLHPARGPGPFARLGRWLGLVGPRSDPRVAWNTGAASELRSLAVNLPLDPRRRGMHVLVVRVTDPATGRTAESRRPLLIR